MESKGSPKGTVVPTREELLRLVQERYGSFEHPDFSWVRPEHARDPYAELRRALGSRLEVKDVTDLNTDVCVAYELGAPDGRGAWVLRVSLLGPYGVLVRRRGSSAEVLLDGAEDAHGDVEAFVVQVCGWAGCALLPVDLLATPVPLRFLDADLEDADDVRLYQALFSDVDVLPATESD